MMAGSSPAMTGPKGRRRGRNSVLEFPSSGDRRLRIEEFDTTRMLAHARQQAEARGLDQMLIVDVDAHHDEASSMREIIDHIADPVQRQFAMSGSGGGRRPF